MTNKTPENQEPLDRVIDRREACKRLGISIRTLVRLQERGEIPFIRISERIIGYRISALEKFLDDRTRRAAQQSA